MSVICRSAELCTYGGSDFPPADQGKYKCTHSIMHKCGDGSFYCSRPFSCYRLSILCGPSMKGVCYQLYTEDVEDYSERNIDMIRQGVPVGRTRRLFTDGRDY